MILGLIVIIGLTAGLGLLARKYCNQNIGRGLGNSNNTYWGMEDDNNRY